MLWTKKSWPDFRPRMLSHCYAGRRRKIKNTPGFPSNAKLKAEAEEIRETTTDFRPGMLESQDIWTKIRPAFGICINLSI